MSRAYVEWTAPASLFTNPPPHYLPEPDVEGIRRALSGMATHCERHAENDRAVCRCLTDRRFR